MAVEQFVADAHHTDTLASIAERLRAADEQHVVVGIAAYGGLEGRFEGNAQILAEVHSEVGQVFHHDDIILCSQVSDGLELLLVQAYPCGIIRIRIDRAKRWIGDGELLTQDNLIPPPGYDPGYDLLLNKSELFRNSSLKITKYE